LQAPNYALLKMALPLILAGGVNLRAQSTTPSAFIALQTKLPTQEEAQLNPNMSCAQPGPMVRWQDYRGPFQKVVGAFGQRLDRTSVHSPHSQRYKPGELLCSLTTKGKFTLFVENSIDSVTFVGATFNAGIDQGSNTDRTFGQGAAGYGKRFGAELADNASSEFFNEFLYPAIFSEDPRYYRLGVGTTRRRLFHAMEHPVVGHREDGKYMFNFSEWLGTTSAAVLGNVYHPGRRPGVGPVAVNVGSAVGQGIGFDVLREFWPEIAKKLKLPFDGRNEPGD
jgi:hypothetical protein